MEEERIEMWQTFHRGWIDDIKKEVKKSSQWIARELSQLKTVQMGKTLCKREVAGTTKRG